MFNGLKCNPYDNINSCLDCSLCSIYLFWQLHTCIQYILIGSTPGPTNSFQTLSTCIPPHFIPFHFNFVTIDSNECQPPSRMLAGPCAGVVCRHHSYCEFCESNGYVCSTHLFFLLAWLSALQGSFNFLIGPDILECSRKYFISVPFIASPHS